MNAKEARSIHKEMSHIKLNDFTVGNVHQVAEARGFLKCLEAMGPVVEALDHIKQHQLRIAGVGFANYSVTVKIAEKALADYRRLVLGENE